MTYCAAIELNEHLVFASDTRTNAGIDHISTFKKLFTFGIEDQCFFCIQTAGNLATSQAVINMIKNDIKLGTENSIFQQNTLFDIANLIGDYTTQVAKDSKAKSLNQGHAFESSFLLGGQIVDQEPKIFLIYSDGNCLHATRDTPFLQIGESKYGKPILDRAIHQNTSLDDAIRAMMVSFDSTIRSNLSVGYPIDLLVYEKDSFKIPSGIRLDTNDEYLRTVRDGWSQGLMDILRSFDIPPENYRY